MHHGCVNFYSGLQLLHDLQAKKKAQQEAAAKRAGGKKGQAKPAAAPAKTAQSDFTDSESEEEEDMQRVSQQNSRFAFLVPDIPATAPKVSLQGASGGLAGLAGVSNPEGFGTSRAVALVEHLAAGLDSDNGEEEEEEAEEEGHEGHCIRLSGHCMLTMPCTVCLWCQKLLRQNSSRLRVKIRWVKQGTVRH